MSYSTKKTVHVHEPVILRKGETIRSRTLFWQEQLEKLLLPVVDQGTVVGDHVVLNPKLWREAIRRHELANYLIDEGCFFDRRSGTLVFDEGRLSWAKALIHHVAQELLDPEHSIGGWWPSCYQDNTATVWDDNRLPWTEGAEEEPEYDNGLLEDENYWRRVEASVSSAFNRSLYKAQEDWARSIVERIGTCARIYHKLWKERKSTAIIWSRLIMLRGLIYRYRVDIESDNPKVHKSMKTCLGNVTKKDNNTYKLVDTVGQRLTYPVWKSLDSIIEIFFADMKFKPGVSREENEPPVYDEEGNDIFTPFIKSHFEFELKMLKHRELERQEEIEKQRVENAELASQLGVGPEDALWWAIHYGRPIPESTPVQQESPEEALIAAEEEMLEEGLLRGQSEEEFFACAM